jgi:heptosyltransferase II
MSRVLVIINKVILLILGISFVFVPRRKKASPSKLLVVQLAKLGDMVCTTPMFRAIKEKYPNAHLVVMGNPVNRELLKGNPYVNEYFSANSLSKIFQYFWNQKFDFVCITSPNFEIAALAAIARTPVVVVPEIKSGWSPYVTIPYKVLSRFLTKKDHKMGSYAPREYLNLLEPIGIYTEDTRKEVYFSKESDDVIDALLPKESNVSMIGIMPSAGNEIKTWAPEKFAELIDMISVSQDAIFVFLGTKNDIERTEEIKKKISSRVKTIDLIGRLSIDELKACISRLAMVIGADTGPQYIAEAEEVPTIDIVGPVDEREQPPTGDIHRIVKAEREKPQLYVMNARVFDLKEAQRQTNAITPQMVYDEFVNLREFLLKSR